MVAGTWVCSQAIVARACFKIAHMGILAPVAVITSGSPRRSPATRAVVVVVTDAIPVELRTSPSELRAGPGRAAAAAPTPSGASAPITGLAAPLALAVIIVGVLAPAWPLRER